MNAKKDEPTKDKELEGLVNEYLKLEDQRNKNIDKLEEINRELALLHLDLEKI